MVLEKQMSLKMVKDYVLLKLEQLEQVSPSGLILVQQDANREVRFGRVTGKGPDCSDGYSIGELVIIGHKKGHEIGEEIEPHEQPSSGMDGRSMYRVVLDSDIEGVITDV